MTKAQTPTVEQLKTWATPRLMRFYKVKYRQCQQSAPGNIHGPFYMQPPTEWYLRFSRYVEEMRLILKSRNAFGNHTTQINKPQ